MDLNTYAPRFDGSPEVTIGTHAADSSSVIWLGHLHGYALAEVVGERYGNRLRFALDRRPEAARRFAWLRNPAADPNCPVPVESAPPPFGWVPPGWHPQYGITVPAALRPGLDALVTHDRARRSPFVLWLLLALAVVAAGLGMPYDQPVRLVPLAVVLGLGVLGVTVRLATVRAKRGPAEEARKIWGLPG